MTAAPLPPAEPSLGQIRQALAQHQALRVPDDFGKPAAVLVPLLPRPDGLHLLFTERSKELKAHAGQVSFPGGSIDPTDADSRAAALRESREEVGLEPGHVEIIGRVDDCPTFVTGFVIAPWVGVIDARWFSEQGRYPWQPSAGEIAALHELPLAAFCDPANRRIEPREHDGKPFELVWYTVQGTVIWGATARILRQLIDLASALPRG